MSESVQPCLFTEGQVTLPEGYQDRVHAARRECTGAQYLPRHATPGETLAAYIDRQRR